MTVALTAAFWALGPSTWEAGADPEWQLTVVEVVATVPLGLATVALLGSQLYTLWAGLPAVVLTAHGVRLRSPFGYQVVPWNALRADCPPRPDPGDRFLHLAVERGLGARRRGLALIPLPWLDIHPWFLADAIRHYAAHPEHRAAIGTPEEHERLRHLLLAGAGAAAA
ncbi:PH domain-containing protein [Asanoa ishikariensis]|nr:PH domain-containing protein [Asanoa ishikariensis]